jgi:glutamate/tyrosine decarboxylase-like PLP-dependent enzyme
MTILYEVVFYVIRVDPIGLAGQWVCDTLNSSVYTYEVGPAFTLMEEEVLTGMRALVGWSSGDGVFAPGGSFANGYAINIARHHLFPQIKVYLTPFTSLTIITFLLESNV